MTGRYQITSNHETGAEIVGTCGTQLEAFDVLLEARETSLSVTATDLATGEVILAVDGWAR